MWSGPRNLSTALMRSFSNRADCSVVAEPLYATYLHETGESYNAGNPTGYSAPHQADQSDVFFGRNAYFMGGQLPMISRHAAVEDTCVGCHMKLNPKTFLSHGAPAAKTHLFRIEEADFGTFCANCHSSAVNGEGIQGQVEAQLASLAGKLGAAAKTKINAIASGTIKVRAYDEAADQYSSSSSSNSNVTIDVVANPVTSVGIEEGHGQIELVLTLTNAISIQFVDSSGNPSGAPKTMTRFGVQLGSLKDNASTVVYALTGNFVRAGWNYFLVHGDGTEGIHNPSFVFGVLAATMAQDVTN